VEISLDKWQKHLEAGIKYLGEGNSLQAEEYFAKSFLEAEALGVTVIMAFTARLLATAQIRNNKLAEAEAGFLKALNYCLSLDNKKGIAEATAGLASVSFVKGDYLEALNLYLRAINIYPANASPLRLAMLYFDLSQVYGRLENWLKAEDALLKAAALCKQNGYRQREGEIKLFLGEVYYFQKKNSLAIKMFRQAASIFACCRDETALAKAQQYIAFISLEMSRIQEALLYQHRVICLYLRHKMSREISESYYLLSNILQYAELYDEAERALLLSLQYYAGSELGLAIRYHSLAAVALLKEDYKTAKEHYLQALKFFQYHGDGVKVGEISEELTFLIKYEDFYLQNNIYQWLGGRYLNAYLPKHEIMIELANSLHLKGNSLSALRCGWRALQIARAMNFETQEIELLIQNISERIRKKNK